MNHSQHRRPGKVYLVGAGPGDPRLITLRGLECLAKADLVLYDGLVNQAVLIHANPSAELVGIGRHGSRGPQRSVPQQQINTLLVEAARQGKIVVYLKGGDPGVFGQMADKTEVLHAAGIPFETVPGVTSALAAAAYAEIPITHGRHCSAIALVTGQEPRNKAAAPLDYKALAAFPGTLIFYMGEGRAEHWSRLLIDGGKSPETPVALVRRCTWPDQQTFRCTLGTLPEVIAQHQVRPPTMILVGEVVSLAPAVSWFSGRELSGTRILLTRPQDQAAELRARLLDLGAEVMLQPAIHISGPPDWAPVDAALGRLDRYDWLVFSSVNGVRYLLERLCRGQGDLRRLGQVRLAAIGPATAEELRRHHLQPDLVPPEYRAEALAEQLSTGARGQRFLLARASRGRELLAQRLSAAGAAVEQVVVYTSTDVARADEGVLGALAAGRIDWVTVTSSAIARSLVAMFGEHLRRTNLASISPVTSQTLRQLGYEPAAEAEQYTMDGLVEAILACR